MAPFLNDRSGADRTVAFAGNPGPIILCERFEDCSLIIHDPHHGVITLRVTPVLRLAASNGGLGSEGRSSLNRQDGSRTAIGDLLRRTGLARHHREIVDVLECAVD